MPEKVARLWLMVEEIRVERLFEITQEDALMEGVIKRGKLHGEDYYMNYEVTDLIMHSPFDSFSSLWRSINGDDSWNSNPWVWVVRYRILSKTGRPSDEDILTAHLAAVKAEDERWQSHISSLISNI
jgi:hypothetical protein